MCGATVWGHRAYRVDIKNMCISINFLKGNIVIFKYFQSLFSVRNTRSMPSYKVWWASDIQFCAHFDLVLLDKFYDKCFTIFQDFMCGTTVYCHNVEPQSIKGIY